jgi:YVTN family beta-propeller protein
VPAFHRREYFLVGLALLTSALALLVCAAGARARRAYVTDSESKTVSVIDTHTNQTVGSIAVKKEPTAIAITPDGRTAYVVNYGSNNVSVIDTQANQTVGSPIAVGKEPHAIAITPNGRVAYVSNTGEGTVSVIDTQTNQTVGSPIKTNVDPEGIAITPDGRTAYLANFGFPGSVSVIDTQANQLVGLPIPAGEGPNQIAITPDSRTVYVSEEDGEAVTVIDAQTNQVQGSPIEVGEIPGAIAITPDGRTAYVADYNGAEISVIDNQTKQVGAPIAVSGRPAGIAITPDGRTAYVTEFELKRVLVIDTRTNQAVGSPIPVGEGANGIAIVPDQPPVASYSVSSGPAAHARPGVPLAFDAAPSSDPDGTIASYAWAFGDGQAAGGGPGTAHTYSAPGTYNATLTLADNEGCSTTLVFTGQTAYCNGSLTASMTRSVTVAYPGVRVKCPKSARPKGCKFKLRVVSKRRKGKAESAVAKAKAKAGHTTVVSLKPKKAFAVKLAGAKAVLVNETLTAKGSKRTLVKKLKIVK